MYRLRSKRIQVAAELLLLCAALCIPAFCQTDPDPNSPPPVVLAVSPESSTTAGVFISNIPLMPGEGASAFRVYGETESGQIFNFPVQSFRLWDRRNRIYLLRAELRDALRELDAPAEKNDLLVSVAWRGLQSNRMRFGTGDPHQSSQALTIGKKASSSGEETDAVGYRWSGDRTRFLEQATFGPTVELDSRIRRIGLRTWLAEQFDAPYPSAAPYPTFSLKPTNPPPDCNGLIDNGSPDPDPFCYVNHYSMYPIQNWFYKEAFYGNAQLRHRVAWALAQLWVTSGVEVQQSSHMTAYHKVLSRNAFGNWRTLMQEMTLNPAMGGYLNMRTSTRYSPNENYAREVLQLFNIGLFMLNQDGMLQLDGQGNPIPTYDQNVVNAFTATFTGWALCEISGIQCPSRVPGAPNFIDPMVVTNASNHDLSAKTLLNYPGSTTTNIPACTDCTGSAVITYAGNSLNQALDNIYGHPNVAPFVSKHLIQQLVTGDPTPAYVGRVAAVFNANRTNPTQLKEVIKAILLDPEARGDIKTDPRYGKLREPVLLVTNIARNFDMRSADRSALSDGVLTAETGAMDQTAFMSPTVFNFYPPDYVVPGTSFRGPEYALYTTGTSITRINFGNTIIFDRINVNAERRVTAGASISLAEMQTYAEADPSGNRLVDMLDLRLMYGTMSAQMRSTILNVVNTVPQSDSLLRAKRAVYLVVTSSQYQVQK